VSDPISVEAIFNKDGTIQPKAFEWNNLHFIIESVGRQWEESDTVHILVMANGDQVFELSFNSSSMCWYLIRKPQDFGRHCSV
jgi:hypothetical protein